MYGLLLLNWGFYAVEEWQFAQHTLRNGGTLLDWTSAFGTTLDNMAWFGLLFLFELETYALPEERWTRYTKWMFLGARGFCYIFLAHTVFAWGSAWLELRSTEPMPGITSLCQMSEEGVSFTHNLEYTLIDQGNCDSLSDGPEFSLVDNSAVTDTAGFIVERRSAWFDLQDAVTWLLVILTIELGVWVQERDITGGPLMMVSQLGKVFYAVLFIDAAYWAWMGHWLYTWDQLLWIGGFWVIEYNMKEWREEIEEHEVSRSAETSS